MPQVQASCRKVPGRCGFTLVELLVVIGIIAVLVGLLLPALVGARREADRAHCLSNMRNLAVAQANYAADNRGYLVQGGLAHGGAHADEEATWFNVLNKYYGGKLAPRCKADVSVYWETPVPGSVTPQLRRCSYGLNGFLDRDHCPWGPGFSEPRRGGQYVKVEHVRKPSETIIFAEMAHAGSFAGADHFHPDLFGDDSTPREAIPVNAAGQLEIGVHGRRGRSAGGWEHRSNFAFVDGHAETLRFSEVYESVFVNRFDPASPQHPSN